MVKSKKNFAAIVASASVCATGVTAFAASYANNSFEFSIEGRDDLYWGISDGVYNSDWYNPAQVNVTYGNLNATNRVTLSVTGDDAWPENNILSEEVTLDGIDDCEINYSTNYVVQYQVYLLATTGDDVSFEGYWIP